jgi:glycosyltransferase involved in cell wall biosynthesis
MRILLTSEARFERAPDGTVWASAASGSTIWNRYLEVFSAVKLAARMVDVQYPSAGCVQASTPGLTFCALPPYSGLGGFARSGRTVRAAETDAVRVCPAVVVRSPSPIAYLAARSALRMGRRYGAQIVGDPDQVFSPGAFQHPLRVPLRYAVTAAQKYVARHAAAVMFVTSQVLQRKYPAEGRVFAGSDVALDDDAFIAERSFERHESKPFTLVTVAALDQPYKGIAILLDALSELRQTGRFVQLFVAGAGVLLPELEARAQSLGLNSNVQFMGQLDREGVRRMLDAGDVFVLPSLTEGLPRALLEAMARGLPAIATNVGGIPELLPPEDLVPPRNATALARRLRDLMDDAVARRAMGERNRDIAYRFHERVQAPLRRAFLLAVRDACAAATREAVCA